MADRSHLTPAAIIDRNGRSTTVYRSAPPGGDGRRAIPSPGPLSAPVPAVDPAEARYRLGDQQVRAYVNRINRGLYRAIPGLRGTVEDTPAGRVAAALAVGFAKDGALPERECDRLLIEAVTEGGFGNAAAALARDSLRVAVRLAPRWPDRGRGWTTHVVAAVIGARIGHPKRAVSGPELAALSAVVDFTLREPRDFITMTGYRGSVEYRRVRSEELALLLRERPQDLDRITAYVAERCTGPVSGAVVAELREWLNATSEERALSGGWL